MQSDSLIDGLNAAQQRAVTAPSTSHLILAGAGSGKTRVLVHRIAWLCHEHQISPLSLLAVTFTNKAAAEMRSRIEQLLQFQPRGMWIGTFHGLAHRMLRSHWREAGLPEGFQIMDSDDQQRLIKRMLKALGIDESEWPARELQWFINGKKEEGIRSQHIQIGTHPRDRTRVELYQEYERSCQRSGVIDFGEILLRTLELLREHESLLLRYRERFSHLLVDEFQDTNAVQYAWLRLLAGESPIFAVGDDDQSIYGWRGAKVENMQRLSTDFRPLTTIKLEQNYRSTRVILGAANALITHNQGRLGKELWTDEEEGEPIELYAAYNEQDEARFIVERIQAFLDHGHSRSDTAILYRSNAQSRALEEALIQSGLPYRVYGGLRFFERAEIKDALAYLRLIQNRDDDPSFERAVNQPPRGIGEKSIEAIRQQARESGESLWRSAQRLVEERALSTRANRAVATFLQLIDELAETGRDHSLREQVEQMLELSELKEHYANEKSERAQARVENLEELLNAVGEVDLSDEALGEMSPMAAFLAQAALDAGDTQGGDWEECVQLMTLHSAKGLEFPLVCIAGLEDGLFPHRLSIEEPGRLEEERRLCYVGITRARRQLILSYAEQRRIKGQENYALPSRFLSELPPELVQEVRPRVQVSRPLYGAQPPARSRRARSRDSDEIDLGGLHLGAHVLHRKFGEGVVMALEGEGSHARVQVNFSAVGNKWLVMQYARLEVVG